MAIWSQPPKAPWELLKEYLEENYPGHSAACDAGYKLIHLELPNISDKEMEVAIIILKEKFPGAF